MVYEVKTHIGIRILIEIGWFNYDININIDYII